MKSHLLAVLLLVLMVHEANSEIHFEISRFRCMKKISQALRTTYLGKYKGKIKKQYQGVIRQKEMFVSLPVRPSRKSCASTVNIIFKVDPSSPTSGLTFETLPRLYNKCHIQFPYLISISGYKIQAYSSSEFQINQNVLGADFLAETNSHIETDDASGTFKLVFPSSRSKHQGSADL